MTAPWLRLLQRTSTMASGRIGRGRQIFTTQASLKPASTYEMRPGSNHGFHVCDCHNEAEGCLEEETMGNTCNCDANLPIPSTDTGRLFD